jgi:O-methyltransferase
MRTSISSTAKKLIARTVQSKALAPLGRPVLDVINYALPFQHMYLSSLRKERRWISELIQEIKKTRDMLIRPDEAFAVVLSAKAALKLPGDMAEVGVFQGGSARLICEVKGDRPLHLFDTFEGLPAPGQYDDKVFEAGGFVCSLESVSKFLSPFPNVHFYKGLFPHTSGPVADKKFSFVNLDVDLYESTLSAIEFFYPRMSACGILLSHDYNGVSGVPKAINEFFADKPETIIELMGSQCMIVKGSGS